jgi:hypothetical protein
MLSHLAVAKERNNYPLHVLWSKNNACNGHFNDVFEPIEGIVFKRGPRNLQRSYSQLAEASGKMIEMNKLLKPKKQWQDLIDSLKDEMGEKYAAVHIRSLKDAVVPNNINVFCEAIDALPKNCKIFVATDNATTQSQMRAKYKDRAVFSSEIESGRSPLRKTSLGIAVVDLFVCRDAEWFIPTTNMPTSYSELIQSLRIGVGKPRT